MMPYVGSSFNVTRAGIHADGLMKDERIYNIFDTKKILNKSAGVMLGPNSGLAGVAYWINGHYGFKGDELVMKGDDAVIELKNRIDAIYEDGRVSAVSEEELETMLSEIDPARFGKK